MNNLNILQLEICDWTNRIGDFEHVCKTSLKDFSDFRFPITVHGTFGIDLFSIIKSFIFDRIRSF